MSRPTYMWTKHLWDVWGPKQQHREWSERQWEWTSKKGEERQDKGREQKNGRTGAQNKFHLLPDLFTAILMTLRPSGKAHETEWIGSVNCCAEHLESTSTRLPERQSHWLFSHRMKDCIKLQTKMWLQLSFHLYWPRQHKFPCYISTAWYEKGGTINTTTRYLGDTGAKNKKNYTKF